jgi:hypothetical protein
MPQTVRELTAYCGLYCGDCIRYQNRYSEMAGDLKQELARVNFLPYAEVKGQAVKPFQNLEVWLETLDALTALQCEHSCRVGGGCAAFPCDIFGCCRENGFAGCWECDDFEDCNKFDFLKPFHGESPRANLRQIRRLGIDTWATQRSKLYVWD